jgi:hypothetical protein
LLLIFAAIVLLVWLARVSTGNADAQFSEIIIVVIARRARPEIR